MHAQKLNFAAVQPTPTRGLSPPWTASGGRTSAELHIVSGAIAHHGRAEDRQVLLHLPVSLFSRQTAHRRLLGAHNDQSQSHRQWLAVTAPAPAERGDALERRRPTCRAAPRCCQTKQVPRRRGELEGRRTEARTRPKKLRFISRGQKASPTPLYYPLNSLNRESVQILATWYRQASSRCTAPSIRPPNRNRNTASDLQGCRATSSSRELRNCHTYAETAQTGPFRAAMPDRKTSFGSAPSSGRAARWTSC